MAKWPFTIYVEHCVKCGVILGTLDKCHCCDYVQDDLYNDEQTQLFLEKSDYNLALVFYPNLMINDFRKYHEYANDIREKIMSFTGRSVLEKLTEDRRDGFRFDADIEEPESLG